MNSQTDGQQWNGKGNANQPNTGGLTSSTVNGTSPRQTVANIDGDLARTKSPERNVTTVRENFMASQIPTVPSFLFSLLELLLARRAGQLPPKKSQINTSGHPGRKSQRLQARVLPILPYPKANWTTTCTTVPVLPLNHVQGQRQLLSRHLIPPRKGHLSSSPMAVRRDSLIYLYH